MDNLVALGLIAALILRVLPYVLAALSPEMRLRMERQKLRFGALFDVGAGTLLTILVVLLVWRREWLPATLLGIISIPSWRALLAGLVTLARTPPR